MYKGINILYQSKIHKMKLLLNLNDYLDLYIIQENLNKVKKIISKTINLNKDGEEKIEKYYKLLQKYQIAKPIYISWLLSIDNNIIKGDIPSIPDLLLIYDNNIKNINQNFHLYDANKKSFRYDTISKFRKMIEIQLKNNEYLIFLDNKYILRKEANKLFENDRWLIINVESFESCSFYGSKSNWCTSETKEHFDNYIENGKLYIVFDKSKLNTNSPKRRFMLHFEDLEFKDMNNSTDFSIFIEKDITKFFKKQIELIESLDLSNTNDGLNNNINISRLKKLMGGISYFPNVKRIDLSYNNINNKILLDLLKTISNNKKIEDLFLNNNSITKLNQEIIDLIPENLKLLSLSENIIGIIPVLDLGRLKYLSDLFLDENGMKYIKIINADNLDTLSLYSNELDKIPEIKSKNLRVLNLDDNLIKEINSTNFKNIPNIKKLILDVKNITSYELEDIETPIDKIQINNCNNEDLLNCFFRFKNLNKLVINYNGYFNTGNIKIKDKKLKYLEISNGSFDVENVTIDNEIAEENITLSKDKLAENEIKFKNVTFSNFKNVNILGNHKNIKFDSLEFKKGIDNLNIKNPFSNLELNNINAFNSNISNSEIDTDFMFLSLLRTGEIQNVKFYANKFNVEDEMIIDKIKNFTFISKGGTKKLDLKFKSDYIEDLNIENFQSLIIDVSESTNIDLLKINSDCTNFRLMNYPSSTPNSVNYSEILQLNLNKVREMKFTTYNFPDIDFSKFKNLSYLQIDSDVLKPKDYTLKNITLNHLTLYNSTNYDISDIDYDLPFLEILEVYRLDLEKAENLYLPNLKILKVNHSDLDPDETRELIKKIKTKN